MVLLLLLLLLLLPLQGGAAGDVCDPDWCAGVGHGSIGGTIRQDHTPECYDWIHVRGVSLP